MSRVCRLVAHGVPIYLQGGAVHFAEARRGRGRGREARQRQRGLLAGREPAQVEGALGGGVVRGKVADRGHARARVRHGHLAHEAEEQRDLLAVAASAPVAQEGEHGPGQAGRVEHDGPRVGHGGHVAHLDTEGLVGEIQPVARVVRDSPLLCPAARHSRGREAAPNSLVVAAALVEGGGAAAAEAVVGPAKEARGRRRVAAAAGQRSDTQARAHACRV